MTSKLKADVLESASAGGNITIQGEGSGTISLADNTAITGTATISSTLGVTGASTLTGATTVGSTLGVTGASTLTGGATVSGLQLPNQATLYTGRNMIINGTGWINQRFGIDVTQTAINNYAMDRWRTYGGPLGMDYRSVGESMTVANTSYNGYFIRLKRTDSQTNNIAALHGVETLESLRAAGKNVTLSFKARKGANFSAANDTLTGSIRSGEGTNQNPISMTNMATASVGAVLTTSWQTFTLTTAIESDKTQLSVDFNYTPVGTVGANDYFDITEVQLELGSVATPPEQPSYQQEISRCQRFFNKSYAIGVAPGTASQIAGSAATNASGTGNGQGTISFRFPVEMRATPTVTFYSPADGAAGNASMAGASNQGLNGAAANANGFYTSLTGATDGQQYFYHYKAAAEL